MFANSRSGEEKNRELGEFTTETSLLFSRGENLITREGFSLQTKLGRVVMTLPSGHTARMGQDAQKPCGLSLSRAMQSKSQAKVQLYCPQPL